MKNKHIFWCSVCLNTSTRPRITFNNKGICNACLWTEEKKKINWDSRNTELLGLIKNIKKNKKSEFDLIIPVSGGKDGSYVTYMCKEKYKLNPLCVTVNPPLRTQLGHSNIETFKKEKNVQLIEINLPHETHMKINKYGLMNHGRPLYGWLIAVFTAVLKVASRFNIDLIMYGEDGEAEYGGVSNLKNNPLFNPSFIKEVYMSKEYYNSIKNISLVDRTWWEFPANTDNIKMTHWSYCENWDSYRNYVVAKKHFRIAENTEKNSGTYTNFSQNDTYLYDLHVYMMYLKFGFGRANQDAGIDVRRGALSREQAVQLANIYDNEFPEYALEKYLDYYKMKKNIFFKTIDKFANKKLFKKVKNKWKPQFEVK